MNRPATEPAGRRTAEQKAGPDGGGGKPQERHVAPDRGGGDHRCPGPGESHDPEQEHHPPGQDPHVEARDGEEVGRSGPDECAPDRGLELAPLGQDQGLDHGGLCRIGLPNTFQGRTPHALPERLPGGLLERPGRRRRPCRLPQGPIGAHRHAVRVGRPGGNTSGPGPGMEYAREPEEDQRPGGVCGAMEGEPGTGRNEE